MCRFSERVRIMTIEDNVDFLNEAKKLFEDIANNPSINETIKTYLIIESLETAIKIICKYQKIEEIVNGWNRYKNGVSSSVGDSVYMQKVSEVVEDDK
jgi:hypothetical protein